MTNEPRYIVIHGTDVSRSASRNQFLAVDRYHKGQSFPKSALGYFGGYHVLIEPSGQVLRYRGDQEVGAHTKQLQDGRSVNVQSLAVCMAGDFDIEHPTEAQEAALRAQIATWREAYGIPHYNALFHRNWATGKTCPGSLLGPAWLKDIAATPTPKDADQRKKQAEIARLSSWLDRLRTWLISLQQQLQRSQPKEPDHA